MVSVQYLLAGIGILFTSLFCFFSAVGVMIYPSKQNQLFLFFFLLFNGLWLGLSGLACLEIDSLSQVLLYKISYLSYFLGIECLQLYFLIPPVWSCLLKPRFLPFLIGPVLFMAVFVMEFSNPEPDTYMAIYYQGDGNSLLSAVSSLSLFIYSVFMILQGIKMFKKYRKTLSRIWARTIFFVILNLIVSMLWTIDKVYSLNYLWYLLFLAGCLPIAAGIVVLYDPNYLYSLMTIIEPKQYVRTRIQSFDVDTMAQQLVDLMEKEKLYSDSELTLNKLALIIDLSSHQLSEVLNTHFNKNFASFVNLYRIEEAKRLLREGKDIRIIDISYESGFQSLSSFNRAFKKVAGCSPSQYKKNNLQSLHT